VGGFGRGRPGWRPVGEHMLRLDVRQLYRKGWLRPGCMFSLRWTRNDNPAGSIGVTTGSDAIRLRYTHTRDGQSETMDYAVALDRTPCNYGGTRTWFLCPRCGRRVAVLYGKKWFWCRHCYGIAYAVENEDKLSRMLRHLNKLRERVQARAGMAYSVTFKPKGMHQQTFDRIRWEIEELEESVCLAEAQRFGLAP